MKVTPPFLKHLFSIILIQLHLFIQQNKTNNLKVMSPGCCGVDWVLDCEQKGHQFNSPSVHIPGLLARFPVGGMKEATHLSISHTLIFLSLSFSPFALCLKTNN